MLKRELEKELAKANRKVARLQKKLAKANAQLTGLGLAADFLLFHMGEGDIVYYTDDVYEEHGGDVATYAINKLEAALKRVPEYADRD